MGIIILHIKYLSNTLELDLSHIFGKGQFPNRGDIHSFISEEMKVTAGMLRGVQHHPRFPKVFIQFEREDDLLVMEAKVKDGLVMKSKGIKIFGYRCDKPMVTIVLNGQDMALEVDEIKRVMEEYGKVVTCDRGKNNDLSTKDNEMDSLTRKVLMVMIMVVTNMDDTSYARRASLVHLFSILMVSNSRKKKTKMTELEEKNIFKKLKF